MPIYEFYCPDCHTIFNFLSRSVNVKKQPSCPKCRKRKLRREISMFAMTGKAAEPGATDDLPIDESRMEQAITALASEAEGINEDDPRQAAQLMRKFSKMTGLEFGNGMEEALGRMEAGEDPERIEQEMGDLIESEDPFLAAEGGAGKKGSKSTDRGEPDRDPTLYEM